MVRPRVHFGADGPRWANRTPGGDAVAFAFSEDAEAFQVVYCDTKVTAMGVLTMIENVVDLLPRSTLRPWLGLHCLWCGESGGAEVIAVASAYRAAVLPVCPTGGEVLPHMENLLLDEGIDKVCGSLAQVKRSLSAVGYELVRGWDISNFFLSVDRRGTRRSLSDVMLETIVEYAPMEWPTRALLWSEELSNKQVKQIALHAYGTLVVVVESVCVREESVRRFPWDRGLW